MRKNAFIYFFCCFCGFICAQKTSNDIDRFGRRIQLDGFLLEWNQKTAHVWENDTVRWYWDAVNTVDGLAGYFRSDSAARCSTWLFSIIPQADVEPITIKIGKDISNEQELYKIDLKLYDSTGLIVSEWLIPWERLGVDSTGHYAFIATGRSECTDSLPPILITGEKERPEGFFTTSFIVRMVLIAALLIVYIITSFKIRNRNRQKESLHR